MALSSAAVHLRFLRGQLNDELRSAGYAGDLIKAMQEAIDRELAQHGERHCAGLIAQLVCAARARSQPPFRTPRSKP